MNFPSTDTRMRTTLCRRRNHSTRCAYLYRESSPGPSVEDAPGCGCESDGRGKPALGLLLMRFCEQALAASPLHLQSRARSPVLRFWPRCLLPIYCDEEAQTHCHAAF